MPSINKWEVKKFKVSDLKVADNNPRIISDKNFRGLVNSIKRFGLVEPIVWNKRTNRIVGGHQRFRVAVEMGMTEVMVLVVDFPEEQERAANLTLNNPEIEGEFDDPIVELLKHLGQEDKDLFKELNFDPLKASLEKSAEALNPASLGGGDDVSGYKTTCPCCGHEWEVSIDDVEIDKV